jgi:hypothetical protein
VKWLSGRWWPIVLKNSVRGFFVGLLGSLDPPQASDRWIWSVSEGRFLSLWFASEKKRVFQHNRPATLIGILTLNGCKRCTRDVRASKANNGDLLRQSWKYQFSTGGTSSESLAEFPSARVAGFRPLT